MKNFCKYCGKPLKENQECSCIIEKEFFNIESELFNTPIVDQTKNKKEDDINDMNLTLNNFSSEFEECDQYYTIVAPKSQNGESKFKKTLTLIGNLFKSR